MKEDEQLKNCRNKMAGRLADVRDAIAQDILSEEERLGLGLKIWLFPRRYYHHFRSGHQLVLAWADFWSISLGRLKLVDAGVLRGGEGRESTAVFTVGKGLLGDAMFSGAEMVKLIHHLDWLSGIEDLSDAEFEALEPTLRRGRSRSDFAALRAKYATAVACPIRPSQHRPAFGCITAHMPFGKPLDVERAEECGQELIIQARTIGAEVEGEVGYCA